MPAFFSRCVVIVLVFAFAVSAQKRNITEKDLFDFTWVSDPQIAPDGASVAFVQVTVNEKREGYDTSIWSVSTSGGEPHRLTSGIRDSAPRWSPDGKMLAFVRVTEKDGKADQPQLFMLPMAGGDSFQFTNIPRGAGQPRWSPDGRLIAFSGSANADDLAKSKEAKKPEGEQRETDVRVITRAAYRFNGAGYLDGKHPQHLWVIAAPATPADNATPKQLTAGKYDEDNIVWATDGSKIYFTTTRVDEPYFEPATTDIYSVSVSGGEPTRVTAFRMGANGLAISPDGKQIAFTASVTEPIRSYSQSDLWVIDVAPGALPRNLTGNFDSDIGDTVGGDNAPPRAGGGNLPIWSPDGKSIIEVYSNEGRTNIARFDSATGKRSDLTSGNQAVLNFRTTADGHRLIYTLSTPTSIGDLYSIESAGRPGQLTHFNNGLFSKLNLTEPEEVWYTSFDGRKIQAWIQKPPNFDPKKKYPLILNIHGGPHAAYGYVFDHEFQWMAAKGYVVLYPNPRGSTTYGQDFGNVIQYHYPGDDYKDLMAGVDAVITRGYVDTAKLGVTGGSGGGLLTDWTVTQTDRFAAAVAQRDISSWADWWYSDDFTLFQATWFKAPPFEDPEDYRARSPITYVNKVKTPMMFVLGEADYRTPPSAGGEQMFRALKYRKVPTVMIRFPNESHELSRSGQPWHRIERLEHIVGWFDHWLMGVPKPEYEVSQQ
ncbi:MAG: S9 family peptidase [Acidobacteriota bacterium]